MAAKKAPATTPNGWPVKRPARIGSEGGKWWDIAVTLAERDELLPADVPIVTLLCLKVNQLDRVRKYTDAIDFRDIEVEQSNGSLQLRPIFAHQRELEKEVREYVAALGLSPASRSKMKKDLADTNALTAGLATLGKAMR